MCQLVLSIGESGELVSCAVLPFHPEPSRMQGAAKADVPCSCSVSPPYANLASQPAHRDLLTVAHMCLHLHC